MTAQTWPSANGRLGEILTSAEAAILPRRLAEKAAVLPGHEFGKLRVGVDLGTAYMVLAALTEDGQPLAGEWQPAQVVRDGLVVDFIGAVDLLREMKHRLEARLGRSLHLATSGYPPGAPQAEVRATAHVVEAAGFECPGLIDEPSAANNLLGLRDGAIVDVGGGTTGVAVVQNGKIVHTADEATGGVHFSLVIAGSLDISLEEAEQLKTDPAQQARLAPLVYPVMEKVASIVTRSIQGYQVPSITIVGGSAAFPGMAQVVQEYTGLPTFVPDKPMYVTPLGIARHCPAEE